MTPDDAFLRAVIDNPDDESLRLIYADYLEENGDAARAEFIRVQCQLPRVPEGDSRRGSLEGCARALHQDHCKRWTAAFRDLNWVMPNIIFHRGFVGEVTVLASGFVRQADLLFTLAPIQHMTVLGTAGHLGPLASLPHLAKLETLDLDTSAGALADSPFASHLKLLAFNGQVVGTAGGMDFNDTPGVRNVRTFVLWGNYFADPTNGAVVPQASWDEFRRGSCLINERGRTARALVARFGDRVQFRPLRAT